MGNCAAFCQANADSNKSDVPDHINSFNCDASDYNKCDVMGRLLNVSHQYSTLKSNISEDFDEILIKFMEDVYNDKGKGIIDDYIHFKEHHEHELERINQDMVE
eukprot:488893_1